MSARIVILGGGYAGVSCARRLDRLGKDLDVTLVNERPEFIERIRLHQFTAGTHCAARELKSLLPQSIRFIHDSAQRISPATRQVYLTKSILDYDILVYAVGSRDCATGIGGAACDIYTLGTLDTAKRTRNKFRSLPNCSQINVVGGGLTGVETAAELAGMGNGHQIRVITDTLASSVSGRGRDYIRQHLISAGVEVFEGRRASHAAARELELDSGETLPTDLTILANASCRPSLARESKLDTDDSDALRVDLSLAARPHGIVGAGDAVLVTGNPLRSSCQAAIPSGIHAAETALRIIAGEESVPMAPKFAVQAVSLGRRSGVLQFTTSDDVPRPHAVLTGKLAARGNAWICASTMLFGQVGSYSHPWL